jgi:DNA invertase Pin-like site-specific DNA recombinase
VALIGYARVSTDDGRQATPRQLDELRAAGCAVVLEEHASGADRARPVLDRLLAGLRPGTTVCVVKLDRLARSTRDLLDIVDVIEKAGAYLRVLGDPIGICQRSRQT